MHDEDNKYGMRVTNNRGDKWIAYGDGMLLNEESESNYKFAVAAVQKSFDHVYNAFLYPEKGTSSSSDRLHSICRPQREKQLPHVPGERRQTASSS